MGTVATAILHATEAHAGQIYGNGPYTDHLSDVAGMVVELLVDRTMRRDAVIVAWLHDIIEDTYVTSDWLRARGYSAHIVEAVVLLTKEWGYDYTTYIAEIRKNPLALLVKKADTFCNLIQSTKEGDLRRIKKYTKQLQLLGGVI